MFSLIGSHYVNFHHVAYIQELPSGPFQIHMARPKSDVILVNEDRAIEQLRNALATDRAIEQLRNALATERSGVSRFAAPRRESRDA